MKGDLVQDIHWDSRLEAWIAQLNAILPENFNEIIQEIDAELKAEGVPPHARSMHAALTLSRRYQIGVVLSPPCPLVRRVHSWFADTYGERTKSDPSKRVAVLADGDIWEVRIPLIYGTAAIKASKTLSQQSTHTVSRGVVEVNACNALAHITQTRLNRFSRSDLNEVFKVFLAGLAVRQAFDTLRDESRMFIEAEGDWSAAVMHLTAQTPNYGQSRWASLQMCEKIMKASIFFLEGKTAPRGHDLISLHDRLNTSLSSLDVRSLLLSVQCTASVRYGEVLSTRDQAYIAHRSSLLIVEEIAQAVSH